MEKFILYTRVSTQKQSLGLEAQRTAAYNYTAANEGLIIAEYQEKESGKNDHRPQLTAALADCNRNNATLLIAKLDRLSRKVGVIFSLKYSGVKFLALDLPEFNTLTLAIFAAIAQQERELISQRPKAALQELKRNGVKLGAPNATITEAQRQSSLKTRRAASLENPCNRMAYALVKQSKGLSLRTLANLLNEGGFTTAKGGQWSAMQVQRLINLYEA